RLRRVGHPEKVDGYFRERRRPHRQNLRVPTNNDRISVVTRVAPAPDRWIADHHEACDLIDCIVLPSCFESGAVSAFMPSAVATRTVKNTIHKEERDTPPSAPEMDAEPAS